LATDNPSSEAPDGGVLTRARLAQRIGRRPTQLHVEIARRGRIRHGHQRPRRGQDLGLAGPDRHASDHSYIRSGRVPFPHLEGDGGADCHVERPGPSGAHHHPQGRMRERLQIQPLC
jgi:hypothetical protein